MSYTAAKATASDMELRRFTACVLNTKTVDWDAAAKDFDSSPSAASTASFRTFIARATKSLKNYTNAKDKISDLELRRFAAAFLNMKDYNSAVNWDAAAADFGGTGKAASFRTFVQRARSKFEKLAGGSVPDGMVVGPTATVAIVVATPVKAKAKRGAGKRKAAEAEVAEDGEEEGETVKGNGARKKSKKSKAVEVKEEDNDVEAEEQDVEVKQETVDERVEEANVGIDAGEMYRDALGALDAPQENGPDEVQEDAMDEAQATEPEEQLSMADNECDGSREDSLADEAAAEQDEAVAESAADQGTEEYDEDAAVEEAALQYEGVEPEMDADAEAEEEHELLF
ncbi:hypothetical protein B0A48_16725 [Cryoendolithus antarcticus]|uniref:Uncharacterized protein n=1 Tax=Cryoendolithus antarcticus TaxID=1507870 RepID=A0A1V8SDD3_9PEZI|nr:hypothetical protein B0A48_16725 [Cryoendolithus antarcticus]